MNINNIKKKKPIIIVASGIFIALLIIGTGSLFSASRINAFDGVFGGKIGSSTWCICSGNYLFSVGPPRPGTFLVTPSTPPLYEYKRVASGVWTLGTYSGSALCIQLIKKKCIIIASAPDVELMGTSR